MTERRPGSTGKVSGNSGIDYARPRLRQVNARCMTSVNSAAAKKKSDRRARKKLIPIVVHHTKDAIRIGDVQDFGNKTVAITWMVDFVLPVAAERQGNVYQKVKMKIRGTTDDAEVYYEAWPVRAGRRHIDKSSWRRYRENADGKRIALPTHDDAFGVTLEKGDKGRFEEWGEVIFYEGRVPRWFDRYTIEAAKGLESSRKRPDFWRHSGVRRYMVIDFDLSSSDQAKWRVSVEARIQQANGRYLVRREARDGFDTAWWETALGL